MSSTGSKKTVLCVVTAVPPEVSSGTIRVERVLYWIQQNGWSPVVLAIAGPPPCQSPPWWRNDGVPVQRAIPFRIEHLLGRGESSPPTVPSDTGANRATRFATARARLRRGLANLASDWVYVPDNKVFGVGPAIKLGRKLIEQFQPDVMWSSSPALSAQMVARELKKEFRLPWLAEFRDLLYPDPGVLTRDLSWWKKNRSNKIEKSIVQSADRFALVSDGLRDLMIERHPIPGLEQRCHVIPPGFEPVARQWIPNPDSTPSPDGKPRPLIILHTGILYAHRSLTGLWHALALLESDGRLDPDELRVRLVGDEGQGVATAADWGVDGYVESVPRVPVEQALSMQYEADVLLLVSSGVQAGWARAIVTGKIGDYLGAQKPILAITHVSGEAARTIRETRTGVVIDPEDVDALKCTIASYLDYHRRSAEIPFDPNQKAIARYSWQNLGREFADVLDLTLAESASRNA